MVAHTSYAVPMMQSPGMGLFDTGLDTSGWGFAEWAIVLAAGGYIVYSVFSTGKRHVSGVRSCIRACREG